MRVRGFMPDYRKESPTWLKDNIERRRRELDGLRIALGEIQRRIDENEESITNMLCELIDREGRDE